MIVFENRPQKDSIYYTACSANSATGGECVSTPISWKYLDSWVFCIAVASVGIDLCTSILFFLKEKFQYIEVWRHQLVCNPTPSIVM